MNIRILTLCTILLSFQFLYAAEDVEKKEKAKAEKLEEENAEKSRKPQSHEVDEGAKLLRQSMEARAQAMGR